MAMYARDVRQNVKTAEVSHGRVERCIDRIPVANIHFQEFCDSRAPAIRGFYRSDAEHLIHVERVYTRALRDIGLHYRLPNALRASSDDDTFSNELH
jgi:hypothetical protein